MTDKKELWEEIHKKNQLLWLTRSKSKSVLKYHDIVIDKKKKNQLKKTIMEIGIGFGNSVNKLSKYYNIVAVDISSIALNRVRLIADTYLTQDLPKIKNNSIDWGFSHLVFQHCDDEMVKFILRNVFEKIKTEGFFSFQFSELPNENVIFDDNYKFALNNDIMHFRSLEKMKQIINNCDGKVLSVSPPKIWPQSYNITWYFIKCNRRE